MKKNKTLQMTILILLAIAIGFVAGLMVDYPGMNNDSLAGSIGKVEKSRNVKITEEDIQLRNDLAEDIQKREAYEKLLGYYYAQAVQTTNDVKKAAELSSEVSGFVAAYPLQLENLKNYESYLENARADLLVALNAVTTLDDKKEVPVMGHLNNASNAISQIKNREGMLLSYVETLQDWLQAHPDNININLEEAHDILTMNVLRSAIISQNKPMLAYLKNNELYSSSEELKAMGSQEKLNALIYFDAEKLGMWISDSEKLNVSGYLADMDKLNSIVLKNADQLGLLVLLNNDFSLMNDMPQLNSFTRLMDSESLGGLMFII